MIPDLNGSRDPKADKRIFAPPPLSSGFTLIEVLVSLSILAIALIAILNAAVSVQDALMSSQRKDRSAMLAEIKLAETRFRQHSQTGTESGTFADYPGYAWEVKVSPTQIQDLIRVTVRVWPEEEGHILPGMTLQEYVYARKNTS